MQRWTSSVIGKGEIFLAEVYGAYANDSLLATIHLYFDLASLDMALDVDCQQH